MLRVISLAIVLLVGFLGPTLADKRVALVIGNWTYPSAPLRNPGHDADLVAKALAEAGFKVAPPARNFDRAAMLEALDAFSAEAEGADIAVIYYSGHGLELEGVNYLVPVDARLQSDTRVKYDAIALDDVIRATEGATRLKLVILDACRENPFVGSMKRIATRGIPTKGLGRVEPNTSNTLIAYATAPGKIATDGDGDNSPFAAALARHIADPGLDVEFLLRKVRDEVIAATRASGTMQEPYKTGSIGAGIISLSAKEVVPPVDVDAEARNDYANAKVIGTVDGWQDFLAKYPNGPLADAARRQSANLSLPVTIPLTAPALPVATIRPPPSTPVVNPVADEWADYAKALELGTTEGWRVFLTRYPHGSLADLAQTKVAQLSEVSSFQTALAKYLDPRPTVSLKPISQKASLIEEAADATAAPVQTAGQVIWQLVKTPSGQAGKPDVVKVQGRVEIPGRGIVMLITMEQNSDAGLQASHLIKLEFKLPPDFDNKSVARVPGIIMKLAENARGDPLTGATAKINGNLFWIALYAADADKTHNLQLVRDRGWVDIPIVYETNKRAMLTLEKVGAGDRVFSDAIAAWAGTPTAAK